MHISIDRLKEFLAENYFSNLDFTISQLAGNNINSLNFKVSAEGDTYICKVLPSSDKLHLQKVCDFLDFCNSKSLLVPRVLKSNDGSLYCTFEDSILFLKTYVQGNIFEGKLNEVASFAEELGNFHNSVSNYLGETPEIYDITKYRSLSRDEVSLLNDKLNKSKIDDLSESEKKFISNIAAVQELYSEYKSKISNMDSKLLNYQIIHNDLTVNNLLFGDDSFRAIIDFDTMRFAPLLLDVSFACFRLGLHENESEDVLNNRIDSFINGYNLTSNHKINSASELALFYMDSCFARIFYILRDYLVNSSMQWAFEFDKHIKHIIVARRILDDRK